ncbi:hypothetical protein B0I26_10387 [Anoxybacillus vitaminiphilus]|uniref:Uncharacterized protein n=1 Tax=Paranoxybacillus vitaminiphilus TaxID=581036 RepID=A0A327YN61_9BACL|nr:hypothetical protein [Anoxybacillus vitaminiphilus]RAK21135.1 hypothetical protein B0I26_10387 [Anoxybacillus vitaminiphilus]
MKKFKNGSKILIANNDVQEAAFKKAGYEEVEEKPEKGTKKPTEKAAE